MAGVPGKMADPGNGRLRKGKRVRKKGEGRGSRGCGVGSWKRVLTKEVEYVYPASFQRPFEMA